MATTHFIGLDVHKDTIAVAIAGAGREEARFFGQIANTPEALAKLAAKLRKDDGKLHFAYEAGCCGYGVYRHLSNLGHQCDVVAPGLIPVRRGERIKNDRRDALTIARLLRAGELTAVWVPDESHEAMRDLVRTRDDVVITLRRSRQQLGGFLLRHGRVYPPGKRWGAVHKRWIRNQVFEHETQSLVLEDYFQAMERAEVRVNEITTRIQEHLPSWSLSELVKSLQTMRGISIVTAAVLAAKIGDFSRFERPSQLMAYVGLVPSEDSSGNRRRTGGITKAGNNAVRRVLVEGAWNYRMPARISKNMMEQQKHLSPEVREIAWKGQVRLRSRRRCPTAGTKPVFKGLLRPRAARTAPLLYNN